MTDVVLRSPRRLATAAVLAGALALAGCGGGDDEPAASTPSTSATTAQQVELVAAVCAQSTKAVPEVPGPDASAAAARRYVRAVRTAMSTLAPDLERLARQEPDRRRVLTDLSRRMRAVATVARRTPDGRATAGSANDLPGTIATLNLAATRAGLPQCGL